jgi:hypothetical protein
MPRLSSNQIKSRVEILESKVRSYKKELAKVEDEIKNQLSTILSDVDMDWTYDFIEIPPGSGRWYLYRKKYDKDNYRTITERVIDVEPIESDKFPIALNNELNRKRQKLRGALNRTMKKLEYWKKKA